MGHSIDREKVIKGLQCCNYYGFHEDCPYDKKDPNEEHDTTCMMDLMRDALALLKEQEVQKFFVDESGQITSLPVVVRCKDCKHLLEHDTGELECEIKAGWFPVKPDWYCADGERRTE